MEAAGLESGASGDLESSGRLQGLDLGLSCAIWLVTAGCTTGGSCSVSIAAHIDAEAVDPLTSCLTHHFICFLWRMLHRCESSAPVPLQRVHFQQFSHSGSGSSKPSAARMENRPTPIIKKIFIIIIHYSLSLPGCPGCTGFQTLSDSEFPRFQGIEFSHQ